jgi:hypothetical protein
MEKTICSVHDDISKEFSRLDGHIRGIEKAKPDVRNCTPEDTESFAESVQSYIDYVDDLLSDLGFSDIPYLASEAKEMGQKMEDGLKARKELMEHHEIEEEYKANK